MPNEMSVKEIVAKLEGPWGCDIVFWNHDLGALQADVLALVADWRKRGTARDLLEKDLDVLSASHKDLASRVAEMGKALKEDRRAMVNWLDAEYRLPGCEARIDAIDAVLAPKP